MLWALPVDYIAHQRPNVLYCSLHTDFPYDLDSQEPVRNVTIPASTGEPGSQEHVENITIPTSTGDSGELGSPESEENVTSPASTGELGSEGHTDDVNV